MTIMTDYIQPANVDPSPVEGKPPLDPPDSLVKSPLVPCPVPGCDKVDIPKNALGPHLAMHRRNGDPGTPPPKWSKASGRKPGQKGPGRPRKEKTPAKLEPDEIADGVLAMLYPVAVPTDRIRQVAAWLEATDRLALEAFADQETQPS